MPTCAVLAPYPHVDLGRGVVSHQDRGQARGDAVSRLQLLHHGGHALAHPRGHGLAVDHLRVSHAS